MIHFKIPMLFYDYCKRTYRSTDWCDVKSTLVSRRTNAATEEDEEGDNDVRSVVRQKQQTAKTLENLKAGNTKVSSYHPARPYDDMFDISSTEVSITSDYQNDDVDDVNDDYDEFFENWIAQQMLRKTKNTTASVRTSPITGKRADECRLRETLDKESLNLYKDEPMPCSILLQQDTDYLSTCSNTTSLSLISPIENALRTIPFVSLDFQWESEENFNDNRPRENLIGNDNKQEYGIDDDDDDDVADDYEEKFSVIAEYTPSGNPKKTTTGKKPQNSRQKLAIHRRIQQSPVGECPQSEPALFQQQHVRLRIPIPTYISFQRNTIYASKKIGEDVNNEQRLLNGETVYSASFRSFHDESFCIVSDGVPDSTTSKIDQSNDCTSIFEELFDPTESLVFGSIDEFQYEHLCIVSKQLYHHLTTINNIYTTGGKVNDSDRTSSAEEVICNYIELNPETCQVKYHLPGYAGPCYPISFFSSIGFVQGSKAAYLAYPEAIGLCDSVVGTPLQYALVYRQSVHVIESLLHLFPESARLTNYHTEKRTPLHLACMLRSEYSHPHGQISLTGPDIVVIELLRRYYPSAVQLADNVDGMTPLHYVCQWDKPTLCDLQISVLRSFCLTSPMAIHAVSTDMQKPLHIAAYSGAPTNVLSVIMEFDPSQIKCTDDHFQTPLHKAIMAAARAEVQSISTSRTIQSSSVNAQLQQQQQQILKENVVFLVRMWPNANSLTDENDETPLELAYRLRCPTDLIELLQHTM